MTGFAPSRVNLAPASTLPVKALTTVPLTLMSELPTCPIMVLVPTKIVTKSTIRDLIFIANVFYNY
jgi:hypothetical protein